MLYKFNGKLEQQGNPDYSGELDEETGLYYYGVRYYDPQISMWYGVDPKAGKYPNVSAYMYTMGNLGDLTNTRLGLSHGLTKKDKSLVNNRPSYLNTSY